MTECILDGPLKSQQTFGSPGVISYLSTPTRKLKIYNGLVTPHHPYSPVKRREDGVESTSTSDFVRGGRNTQVIVRSNF